MSDKGLKADAVGLFGGTLLGISSVAPAYVLTATVGILAVAVGEKTPVVIIAGFLPMFLAAYAYREFNQVMPARFAHIHSKYKSPSFATLIAGLAAGVFYTVMTVLSEQVLTDTILALGIMICFYYGLVAFGCVWFFRRHLFDNAFNFVFKFLFPLLGGLGLFFVLIITLRDSADPEYGSGASVFGIGLVLVLGLGLILIGVVFMLWQRAKEPAFFRGETLKHEAAHTMKQHEHLEF